MKRPLIKIISIISLLLLTLTACSNVSNNNVNTPAETKGTNESSAEVPTGYPSEVFCIYGRYLNLADGRHMIIKYGSSNTAYPVKEEDIIMQSEGEPILLFADNDYAPNLDDIESNTVVWAIVDTIRESWPEQTTVYGLSVVVGTGLITVNPDNIPQIEKSLLDRLSEAGYEVAGSNVTNNDVNTSFEGQSESKESSIKIYEVSGSFTATVEDLLPNYGVDDSIGWAVVHEFQGPSYLLYVRYLDTDSMEIGKTYVFDVVPIPVDLNGLTLPDNSLARWSLSGFREAKEDETGLNSLSLDYKEITLPSEKTGGRSIDDDVTTTVSGSFTASLKKLLPYYGVDDRNCLAVVFEFQGQPFLINLMNIDTDSLKLDKAYVFTVEPKTFDGYIYHTNEIVQYLNIVDCRPAEGNESGLESLQLEFDEIIEK